MKNGLSIPDKFIGKFSDRELLFLSVLRAVATGEWIPKSTDVLSDNDGFISMNRQRLAMDIGMSPFVQWQATQWLENHRLITTRTGRYKSVWYKINFDALDRFISSRK